MARIGPVVLEVVGDQYPTLCRIAAMVWEGETSSGDQIEVRCPTTGALLWGGRTEFTQTYLGANIGPFGINAPHGFYAARLDNGRVLVYLTER